MSDVPKPGEHRVFMVNSLSSSTNNWYWGYPYYPDGNTGSIPMVVRFYKNGSESHYLLSTWDAERVTNSQIIVVEFIRRQKPYEFLWRLCECDPS